MDSDRRIERVLLVAIESLSSPASPPGLLAATHHAVFPGGARIRPRLCLAVAAAYGDPAPEVTDAVAAAVELIHCASLVHDDLPCFDDAPLRRGQPSVHRAFGEPIAVLTGDQLIVLAFEALARGALHAVASGVSDARKAVRFFEVLAAGVGMPQGIIAGQAWESEAKVPIAAYRRAKTGALFEAAAVLGALSAGQDGGAWGALGQRIGEAYQVADDVLDLIGQPEDMGKLAGRDGALGRPNTAMELGLSGTTRLLQRLIQDALESVPPCPRADDVRSWATELGDRLMRACRSRAAGVSATSSA
ncbi:geranylgeranyl pyrophosphate synthase [Sorangium cellulosum]|uniref:Geranylgeranyl pyrophosphate synthase n=1 Tax=Sorangium cellulosum TaxID=56 RepID=A0A2L0EJI4_SORCE|nr:polyprenyl synthetase family protein [Sorangium cellulosum]AUX39456.1 geranylgeranyl pyrophosphate synthase [Sorangium cellulosum]